MADLEVRDLYHLGARPIDGGTDFVVSAPYATAVDLCLVDEGGTGEHRIGMRGPVLGFWNARVPGVGPGQRYGYRVHGAWDPDEGLLFNPRKLVLDPYARAIDATPTLGPEVFAHAVDDHLDPTEHPLRPSELDSLGKGALGVVTEDGFTVVPGPRVPQGRTVIYEAHVKGLTQTLPGVPEELRGTYAGLAHPVTVAHLKNLGVTTIELLPIHASFSEAWLQRQGRTNYWGYSTLSYFAPEPSYATAAARERGPLAVLDEVRGMVSMLHEAGLEVVLDVVYNHTCEGGVEGPALSLRGIDNLGYYLHSPYRPAQYADLTGTGNTIDFRYSFSVRLTLDSLRYWAQNVGVDGFRFDLAATLGRNASEFSPRHPLLIAMATDPVLSGVKLITEPWDIGPGGWQTGNFPAPFMDWNDRYRGTVRSFWLHDASELSKGRPGNDLRDLATRISGSADMFIHGEIPGGRGPLASVNFVTAHDGFTLRDLVSYEHKQNLANGEANRDGTDDNRSWNHGFEGPAPVGLGGGPIEVLRRRSIRNVLGTLLVSAGTPMLLGGDEMGRTQRGNNNAYCQDNELSWVDWELDTWQRDLIATTRFLIGLRRDHPVLRPDTFATGQVLEGDTIPDLSWFRADGQPMSTEAWHDPYTRVVQMLRSGRPFGDVDALVLINGALDQVDLVLPEGHNTEYQAVWDSNWAVPRPDTSDFARARRVRRARAAGMALERSRHDRPGDVTTLDALSMRIYLSGDTLEGLAG